MNAATETKSVTFTAIGNVRGSCGHNHRTIDTAAKCLRKDKQGCMSQGGYSDRQVRRSDGAALTNHDYATIETIVTGSAHYEW